MQKKEIHDLIAGHLTGSLNPDEDRMLRQWLEAKEENMEVFVQLKENWQYPPVSKTKIIGSEDIKSKIWSKYTGNHNDRFQRTQPHSFRFVSVAATIAIIVSSIFAFYYYEYYGPNEDTRPSPISYIQKENLPGRKSTIFLNDGTIVNLNSASSIRYPEVFSDSSREVYLEGEAYFEVAKDADKPFTVITKNIRTLAVGTAFNIKSFSDSKEIEISLTEGKVHISDDRSSVKDSHFDLLPGQQIVYSMENERFLNIEKFDANETLGWKDGILYFKKANFSMIKNDIERWFGVKLQVQPDHYPDISYTGEFHNQSLQNILYSIGFVQKFNFDIKGTEVFIQFNDPEKASN